MIVLFHFNQPENWVPYFSTPIHKISAADAAQARGVVTCVTLTT